jgi:hypothetical protein
MMNLKLIVVAVALSLGGCATSYDKYLDAVKELNKSNAQTEQVAAAALQMDSDRIAKLGESGGDIAKVVASLAISQQNMVSQLAKSKGGSGGSAGIVPQPPEDPLKSFVQILGIALPTASNVYAVVKNTQAQVDIARVNATIEQSRNQTFSNIATAAIQGVASVNVQPNVTTNVTAGGDAVNGNRNTLTRCVSTGGAATTTGTGGAAAPGGNGGNSGTTGTGGAGAGSGPAGSTNPVATAGGSNC